MSDPETTADHDIGDVIFTTVTDDWLDRHAAAHALSDEWMKRYDKLERMLEATNDGQ